MVTPRRAGGTRPKPPPRAGAGRRGGSAACLQGV